MDGAEDGESFVEVGDFEGEGDIAVELFLHFY